MTAAAADRFADVLPPGRGHRCPSELFAPGGDPYAGRRLGELLGDFADTGTLQTALDELAAGWGAQPREDTSDVDELAWVLSDTIATELTQAAVRAQQPAADALRAALNTHLTAALAHLEGAVEPLVRETLTDLVHGVRIDADTARANAAAQAEKALIAATAAAASRVPDQALKAALNEADQARLLARAQGPLADYLTRPDWEGACRHYLQALPGGTADTALAEYCAALLDRLLAHPPRRR